MKLTISERTLNTAVKLAEQIVCESNLDLPTKQKIEEFLVCVSEAAVSNGETRFFRHYFNEDNYETKIQFDEDKVQDLIEVLYTHRAIFVALFNVAVLTISSFNGIRYALTSLTRRYDDESRSLVKKVDQILDTPCFWQE